MIHWLTVYGAALGGFLLGWFVFACMSVASDADATPIPPSGPMTDDEIKAAGIDVEDC